MGNSFKYYIQTRFFSIGILLLNIFYFIPRTIEWLTWKSGVTMGYVSIELMFNYFIHVFFIYSCLSFLAEVSKQYKLYLLFLLTLSFFMSFFFAYRIIEAVVIIFACGYALLFYYLFRRIRLHSTSSLKFNRINSIGFFISLLWLILDIKYFN